MPTQQRTTLARRARSSSTATDTPLRVLCVHGVGDHHSDLTWQADWARAVAEAVARFAPAREVVTDYLMYDDVFRRHSLGAADYAGAVWRLSASGVVHGVADAFRRSRGVADIPSRVRWTAGMVVQWAQNDLLRKETRALLEDRILEFRPGLICAHSLGSLVAYDTLSRDAASSRRGALSRGVRLMTLGSQIGHPFVRNTFGGRIVHPGVDFWYHLFNRHDDVFAAEISLPRDGRFVQIDTHFDRPGVGDHDALGYLAHPRTADRAWREIAAPTRVPVPIARAFRSRQARPKPRRRAVLVGINDYPDPADRLEGCVNDVFTMSALLQETGFDPDDIRVVLDARATAAGILERLQWLLDGVADDPREERVFYYSGHGAQIPMTGESDRTDHLDECLVPYDFDWSHDRALTDDQFFELYSQLPYRANFVAVFDCCHAGGMTRTGGPRVRGLSPPDDIRHRDLRWDPETRMWTARALPQANRDLFRRRDRRQAYVGASGAKHRLGRAIPLRRLSDRAYDAERKRAGHLGPYLPVILQACEEGQLSYEYRHGVTSHGAFTYSLSHLLNERRTGPGKPVTFTQLKRLLTQRLRTLNYEQTPCLVGPRCKIDTPVPWRRQSSSP